jgi:acyl-CoA reductase-like NAD-dependent aldehyde dehydrogenase
MHGYQLYIAGKHAEPASGNWLDSTNPCPGEARAQIAQGNASDVHMLISAGAGSGDPRVMC